MAVLLIHPSKVTQIITKHCLQVQKREYREGIIRKGKKIVMGPMSSEQNRFTITWASHDFSSSGKMHTVCPAVFSRWAFNWNSLSSSLRQATLARLQIAPPNYHSSFCPCWSPLNWQEKPYGQPLLKLVILASVIVRQVYSHNNIVLASSLSWLHCRWRPFRVWGMVCFVATEAASSLGDFWTSLSVGDAKETRFLFDLEDSRVQVGVAGQLCNNWLLFSPTTRWSDPPTVEIAGGEPEIKPFWLLMLSEKCWGHEKVLVWQYQQMIHPLTCCFICWMHSSLSFSATILLLSSHSVTQIYLCYVSKSLRSSAISFLFRRLISTVVVLTSLALSIGRSTLIDSEWNTNLHHRVSFWLAGKSGTYFVCLLIDNQTLSRRSM